MAALTAARDPYKDPYDASIQTLSQQINDLKQAGTKEKISEAVKPIIENLSKLTKELDHVMPKTKIEVLFDNRALSFALNTARYLKYFENSLTPSEQKILSAALETLELQKNYISIAENQRTSKAEAAPTLPNIENPHKPIIDLLNNSEQGSYIIQKDKDKNLSQVWVKGESGIGVFVVSDKGTIYYDLNSSDQHKLSNKNVESIMAELVRRNLIDITKGIDYRANDDVKVASPSGAEEDYRTPLEDSPLDEDLLPNEHDPAVSRLIGKNEGSYIIQKTDENFGCIWVKGESDVGVYIYEKGKVTFYNPITKQGGKLTANSFKELFEELIKQDVIKEKNEVK